MGDPTKPAAPSPSRDQGTSDADTPPRWPGQMAAEALPPTLVQALGVLLDAYVAHAQAGFPLGATGARSCEAEQRVVSEILALVRSERSRATEAERARDEAVRVGLESTRTHEADLLRWTSERDALRVKAYEAERRLIAAERRAEAAERLMKAAAPLANADIIGISVPAVASDDVMTRWHNAVRAVCREVRALAASPSRKGDATAQCPTCDHAAHADACSAEVVASRTCSMRGIREEREPCPCLGRAPATPSNEETKR